MATLTTSTPATQTGRTGHLLAPVWRDQRRGIAAAVLITGLSGLLVALAMPRGAATSEYNLIEKVNVLRGLMDMFTVLYPQLQELDFRRDVPRLAVPVYLLDGAAELSARRDLAHEWFTTLQAPTKRMFTLDNAAHAVAFEQFEAFGTIMRETVLPETYRKR